METPIARVKLCLFGAGRMGALRAPLIYANPRMTMACVVDPQPEAGKALAALYGMPYYATFEEAVKKVPELNAVWISTPTFTHKGVVELAAVAGIHIFIEKPVAEDAAGCEELFDIAEKAKIQLCCGFQRRFDPSYVALRDAVKSGKVGTPVIVRIMFGDHPAPPIEFLEKGGDPFMDLSPHDVDFVRWVLDDEPIEITGTGSSSTQRLADAGVLDNAHMTMKFSRGAMCSIMMSRGATYGYDQRVEVFGDKGIVSVANEAASLTVVADSAGIHSSGHKFSFPQRFNAAFAAEVASFAAAVLDKTPWPVSRRDCVQTQKVAGAAMESCKTGNMVKFAAAPRSAL